MISQKTFSKLLFNWSDEHPRRYPWTGEKDPYKIWISEIILQQTRTEQAKEYYLHFINTFPNIKTLAASSEDDVLNCWKGLGYYTRARNIYKTALILVDQYHSKIPKTYEEIISLKGIGEYTAAAISSFAFNIPKAVVDGNVIRVLSRLFGLNVNYQLSEGKKIFHEIASQYLNIKQPARYNQAIMDFGATQCKPSNPDCTNCIFSKYCIAYQNNVVDVLPFKTKTRALKKRYFHYFLLENEQGEIAITQRLENDIWHKLYQLPLIETTTNIELNKSDNWPKYSKQIRLNTNLKPKLTARIQQKLSHQEINSRFYYVKYTQTGVKIKQDFYFVKTENLVNFAFPKIIRAFFEQFKPVRLC